MNPAIFSRPEQDLLWELWNFGPYDRLKNSIYDHIVRPELLRLF